MASPEQIARLRRNPAWLKFSRESVDLWNRAVTLFGRRVIERDELLSEIDDIRRDILDLRGRATRARMIFQPLDPDDVARARTNAALPFFVSEDMDFDDLLSNIVEVLELALDKHLPKMLANIRFYCEREGVSTHTPDKLLEATGYFLTKLPKAEIFDKAKEMVNTFLEAITYNFLSQIHETGSMVEEEEFEFDYAVEGKVERTERWTIKVGLSLSEDEASVNRYLVTSTKTRYIFQLLEHHPKSVRRGSSRFTALIDEDLNVLKDLIRNSARR